MAVCSTIYKNGIDQISFLIFFRDNWKPELDLLFYKELLIIRENYWHNISIINPSYNIQLF